MANTAEIGRFDGVLHKVPVVEGDTVQDLLDKAGLTVDATEQVNNGMAMKVEPDEKAHGDEQYLIVRNNKNGM